MADDVLATVVAMLPLYSARPDRSFMALVWAVTASKVDVLNRATQRGPRRDAVPEGAMGRALALLPDEHRKILRLRLEAGLSLEETAVVLGTTPGAVRVGEYRALTGVREIPGAQPGRTAE